MDKRSGRSCDVSHHTHYSKQTEHLKKKIVFWIATILKTWVRAPILQLDFLLQIKKLWHKRIPCRTFLLNSHYSHCRAPKYLHHQSPKVEKRNDTEYGWWSPEEPCTNEARKPVGRVCVWPHFSNLSRECRAWSRRVDRLLSGDPGNSESRRMTEETYCQWRRVPGSPQQKN